jgi:ABC-2 type transport system permease protein
MRYRLGSAERKAASRKSPTMWLVSAFVAMTMLGSFTVMAHLTIANIESVLGSVQVRRADSTAPNVDVRASTSKRSQPSLRPIPPAPGSVLSPGVLQGVTLEATLFLILALVAAVASRELTRPEWDLEWLITLPLPLPTLMASMLMQRVMTNFFGFQLFATFLSVLAWRCGYRWTAPLLGIGFTLALLLLVAIVQMLIDTGLRLSLSPPRLRNLHAVITVVSLPLAFLAMSMAFSDNSFVFGWASALPESVRWLPTGLAVRALASADIGAAALWSITMIVEILIAVAIGFAVLHRQMRKGVVAAGAREGIARVSHTARYAGLGARTDRRTLLSPVQRRELRLLGRDRTFMVQTLFFPAMIVGFQIFFTAGTSVFVGAVEHPSNLTVIAFVVAAYTLAFSAFQTLNAEGQALWILYCVPHSLESVLWQKAKLWTTIATIYPLVIFGVAIAVTGYISLQFIGSASIVLLGVLIFAVIATALGVFGCNPLQQDVYRRVRLSYLYLYMILASFYAYAIYANTIWQRAALIILTALVAIALWQKARDQFDYLLDPSASPPPRVSVSDGLIAALMFFVLQAILTLVLMAWSRIPPAEMIWIAFCGAGATTYGLIRVIYWRARTADVPRMLHDGISRALLWGIIGGIASSLAAFIYIQVIQLIDLFPTLRRHDQVTDPSIALWLATLAVIAAPVFEEFIFRGLIFGGLRRSLNVGVATVASAAIFAIVHPPASVIPVFVMGVCVALVYERTRMLAAPVVSHSIYNAAVLALQWNIAR